MNIFQGIVVFSFFIRSLMSTLISSANITHCFDSATTPMACSPRLLLSLTVDNGQLENSESLSFALASFRDKNNNVLNLTTPLALNITKTPVSVIYYLKYRRNFAFNAFERVVKTSWPFCSEGVSSQNQIKLDSTCKYKLNSSGYPIEYSQGFCCTCSAMTLITGLASEVSRGNCQQFGSSQTAHCLEFDRTQYSGYEIIDYVYDYKIGFDLAFETTQQGAKTKLNEYLTINKRSFINEIFQAKIIGNFLPSRQPPNLAGQVLLKPDNQLGSGLTKTLQPVEDTWLIVDKAQVTFDGTECNKIGTSFYAFHNQNSKCEVRQGSCLNNQIADLLAQDNMKISRNGTADYLLKSKGKFKGIKPESENTTRLEMEYEDIFTTQIVLEIDASHFNFTSTLGKAVLTKVEIPSFEAQTNLGRVYVSLQNTGSNAAKFEIALNCSADIQLLPSKFTYLLPGQSQDLEFKIAATIAQAKSHLCNVTLTNNFGEILDQSSINFETSERQTIIDSNATSLEQTSKNTNQTTISKLETFGQFGRLEVCEYLCTQLSSLHCYILNGCSGQLQQIGFYLVGVSLLSLIIAVIGICCFKRPLGFLLKVFFCCRRKKSKEDVNQLKSTQTKVGIDDPAQHQFNN